MRALRAPVEPASLLRSLERAPRSPAEIVAAPFAAMMFRRIRNAGLITTDRVFGLRLVRRHDGGENRRSPRQPTARPHGDLHASGDSARHQGATRGYRYAEELSALLSKRCREAMQESGAAAGGYGDLVDAGARRAGEHASETARLDPTVPGKA